MNASPQGTPLKLRIPQPSGLQALLAAEREFLVGRQAARRAVEVMTAYEARHGEEPLSR